MVLKENYSTQIDKIGFRNWFKESKMKQINVYLHEFLSINYCFFK